MKKLLIAFFIMLGFMQVAFASEISYDKNDFAPIYTVIDDAAFDIRYYSPNNFTGNKINGYKAPVAYMTKESLKALAVAAEDLRKQGYRLLIWDSYRPQKAVDNFVEWINNPNDEGDKSFYPNLKKSELLKGNYIAEKSGHTRGSTVDLTLIKKMVLLLIWVELLICFLKFPIPIIKNLQKNKKQTEKFCMMQ